MKHLKIYVIFLGLFFGVTKGNSHGDETPGPNGGQIRMPGAFHTEVISKPKGFQVYLLDIEFKNPTVENSTLNGIVTIDDKKNKFTCQPIKDHFFCPYDGSQKSGNLELMAVRNSVKGIAAQYKLPLK